MNTNKEMQIQAALDEYSAEYKVYHSVSWNDLVLKNAAFIALKAKYLVYLNLAGAANALNAVQAGNR